MTQNEPDLLTPLLQKSALRNWLKALGSERHDRLLVISEATKVELIWWYLAWAFERPEIFAPEEQGELIAGIDTLADHLNAEPAVRTATYLQASAQLFKSEPVIIGAAVHFETCTRLDRLADLWAWNISG